ncbi:MAG: spheroidene monooxygenase [Piscinibacter sp.]|uniref:spheroidene monooxygenase n=1 Tax=Piscinibacter sp. TaxID=1903157 RepID=UPI003D150473
MTLAGPSERSAPMARGSGDAPLPAREPQRQGAQVLHRAGSIAVLLLVDYPLWARPWGWMRLVLQRWPLRHERGLRFSKVLGSGHEGGFGLRPSGSCQGLFLVFDDEAAARGFIEHSPVLARYRAHARECCVALLRAVSCKGSWSGVAMAPEAVPQRGGPVAALTRASIKPGKLAAFWRHSPPSEAALAASPGCTLAVGLGEAPLLRQCTFSLWESVAAMDAYARSGAHLQAIRSAYAGDFFTESMFVRFELLELRGTWKGRTHGG